MRPAPVPIRAASAGSAARDPAPHGRGRHASAHPRGNHAPPPPQWRLQSARKPKPSSAPTTASPRFERLEIYNRQYWFRLYTCFEEDFPGLQAIVGRARFDALMRAYLTDCPSESFSLRNLGSRLETWLDHASRASGPSRILALDMVRLEWAHIEAFDSEEKPAPERRSLRRASTRIRHCISSRICACSPSPTPSTICSSRCARRMAAAHPPRTTPAPRANAATSATSQRSRHGHPPRRASPRKFRLVQAAVDRRIPPALCAHRRQAARRCH